MEWERFHHICRRSLAPLRPGESLGKRIKAVDADPDTALYGAPLRSGSLPRRILDRIAVQRDQNRALRMLEFYASLNNLATETAQPLKPRRLGAYLAWVSVLSAVILGLYQFREMLGFIPLIETVVARIHSLTAVFRENALAITMAVVVLLILALVMGHALRGLADWSSGRGRGGLALLLASSRARAAHADLEAAVLFPLGARAAGEQSRVPSHLWKLEEEGLDIREEVAALLRCRHRTLVERCEKQMSVVYAFCIVLVAVLVALFLTGPYSPILMMG